MELIATMHMQVPERELIFVQGFIKGKMIAGVELTKFEEDYYSLLKDKVLFTSKEICAECGSEIGEGIEVWCKTCAVHNGVIVG